MRLRLTRARRSRCGVVAKEESCLLDGLYLGTGGGSEARIWDMKSGREVARMAQGFVFAVAFSPSGQHLATASIDRTAHIWEVSSFLVFCGVDHNVLAFPTRRSSEQPQRLVAAAH